jgi:hypothetical protein
MRLLFSIATVIASGVANLALAEEIWLECTAQFDNRITESIWLIDLENGTVKSSQSSDSKRVSFERIGRDTIFFWTPSPAEDGVFTATLNKKNGKLWLTTYSGSGGLEVGVGHCARPLD